MKKVGNNIKRQATLTLYLFYHSMTDLWKNGGVLATAPKLAEGQKQKCILCQDSFSRSSWIRKFKNCKQQIYDLSLFF